MSHKETVIEVSQPIGLLPVRRICSENISLYSDIDMLGMDNLGDVYQGSLGYTEEGIFYVEDANDFKHFHIVRIMRKIDFQRLPIIKQLPNR